MNTVKMLLKAEPHTPPTNLKDGSALVILVLQTTMAVDSHLPSGESNVRLPPYTKVKWCGATTILVRCTLILR